MPDNNDLQKLEEELYGINNAVAKTKERLELITNVENVLGVIYKNLSELKEIALNSYNTEYSVITDKIHIITQIAREIPYEELNDINKDEIIPQGSISYNFNNINYNTLVMALPKSPPICRDELNNFIKDIDTRCSNVMLQLSQIKSYKKKLKMIIDKLSITAVACYLCS